jgi:hypothetical protein
LPYIDLTLPSGVYGNGTELQASGRWWQTQLVRFTEKTVRPVGGWVRHSSSAVTGKGRALISWSTNDGTTWIGIGTESHLYAMSRSGVLSDITPVGFTSGRADGTVGGGYGFGLYGAGTYGTPRPDTAATQPATVWTLDTWGQDLVGMNADDAKAYEWALNVATPAAAISGAPTGRALVVTEQRHLMILGAGGDPRKVSWSDQEDNTKWTPDATNQAGFFTIQSPGRLQLGKRLTGEVGLWTDVDFWTANYTEGPLWFSFTKKGSDCGVISQGAVAVVGTSALWMGQNGFFSYDGYVKPLECEVFDRVFSNINRSQASKVHAVHNSSFGEVWWFYPSSASNEIDLYVIYNYREGWWANGSLARLSGADRGAFNYPLMVGNDGIVYEHETGFSYTGQSAPECTGGPFQIGLGDQVFYATQLVADELTQGDVQVAFDTRFYPNGSEVVYGPYSLSRAPTDVRFGCRQAHMTLTTNNLGDWRWGRPRLNVTAGGRR